MCKRWKSNRHDVSALYWQSRIDGAVRCFRSKLSVALGALAFGLIADGSHADWPEFRGPFQNGTASVASLPLEWSAEPGQEKNIVWQTPTEGLGWSSPIIVGDRIYITSARPEASDDGKPSGAQSLILSMYNVENGTLIAHRPLFQQPAEAPDIHKKNSHASPTLVAHEGRLYVHFGHQGTACTDLDGNLLWSNRDHTYPPVHGNGGSPIVVGDRLIVTCDGGESPYTLALDLATGNEVWKTPRRIQCDRPFSFATPQWIEANGRPQIISPGSDIVQSLDPATGKILWTVSYSGFSVVPRPIFHRGLVFVCTGYMAPKLLAIDPTGVGDVTDTHVRWTFSAGVPNTPSLVPVDDQIVMVSDGGVATGIRAEDGKKLWQKRLGGNYSASPFALRNRVYFQSESGEAIVLEVGESANEIARASLPGRVFASYAVHANDFIIRTEDRLVRIGAR
jgi:outer membrane protein assembly factor BamB